MGALASKSILIAAHGQDVARYRLPETLRQYGQERLQESGECAALRRRHRDWHEQLARRVDIDWLSPQIADLTARLFREHANMQAALDFCQTEPGEAEAGLRIAIHAWFFHCWIAGYVSEGRYRLSQVLARATEPTVWRAQGLLLASFLAALGGDRGAVQPLLEQGTRLAGQLNDPATRAFAAWVAGHLCLFAGDLPQAIAYSEDGLAVLPATVRGRQRAHLLICLASAAGLAGDEERVVACRRELATLTEAGSEYIRGAYSAYSLWALGAAAWRRDDLDRATGLQQQSLRLRSDDRMGSIYCVEALAWIAGSRHQYEHAAVLLGAATGLLQSMGATLEGSQHVAGYHRDCENQARQALGEPAFQAAYHRGLGLSADDVLAYALQQPTTKLPKKPPEPAVSDGAPLTPRELQVARLIAGGRSNKDIAAELVISQRTAENHVAHILIKLGFTSRAKVAAWVAASQPDA